MTIEVTWKGHNRKAQCAPNPDYPEGIDLDLALGRTPSCKVALPYPAVECGIWLVKCSGCGFTGVITAAGRPDDPRSVRVPCQPKGTH